MHLFFWSFLVLISGPCPNLQTETTVAGSHGRVTREAGGTDDTIR